MSVPWLKFYPRDWRGDQALRIVSLSARGLWIECLCIMHEATPYGHLVVNGRPVGGDALARMVGISGDEARSLLAELYEAGVYGVTGEGVIFSRRMCRDQERSAKGRKAVNRRWGQPTENKGENDRPNRSANSTPITQIPEARSQTTTSPSPERMDNQLGGADAPKAGFAFVGKIIRLKQKDYDRWRKTYHAVPDMLAELTKADDYYSQTPPKDGKWFYAVSSWLDRVHNAALSRRGVADDQLYRGVI